MIDVDILSSYLSTKVNIPKRGDLKNLLNLSISNAKMVLDEKMSSLKLKPREGK